MIIWVFVVGIKSGGVVKLANTFGLSPNGSNPLQVQVLSPLFSL